MELSNLSLAELTTLAGEKKTAYDALMAVEDPTDEQMDQAEALGAERDEIAAAIKAASAPSEEDAEKEKQAKAARKEALASRKFSDDEPPEETDEQKAAREKAEAEKAEADAKVEDAPAEEGTEAPADVAAAIVTALDKLVTAAAARPPVTTKPVATIKDVAARSIRPRLPRKSESQLSLVASANVPDFSPGQELDGVSGLTEAALSVMRGFTPPNGDGESVDLRKFGVAKIKVPFADDRIVKPEDAGSALRGVEAAIDESNIDAEGANSLVAAGGWCAPSEVLYDLPADESTDGILSLPEIQVSRGGIRFTLGPQFADFYANAGFVQTEAQAIAATVKPCYEVTCPSFTDVRMDAVGLCIKVPILTAAGYPELTNRFTSGTLVAHEHMKNANVIGRLVTSAGAARDFSTVDGTSTSYGGAFDDALAAIDWAAQQRRQTYRLSFNRTMEVVIPHYALNIWRADVSRRNTRSPGDPVVDQMILAEFKARNLNPQFVYDWQDMSLTDEIYPATFNVLMYPAGTFVKGVSDVINLSAVYDAASLSTNVYTGLFMESGLLVARRQYAADQIKLATGAAGRTGAADLGAVAAA